jgi:hypothetical protein
MRMNRKYLTALGPALLALLLMAGSALAAQDRGKGWPDADILKQYGLEGMPQPVGTSAVDWLVMKDGYGGSGFFNFAVLYIRVAATSATEGAVKKWFGEHGWKVYADGSRSMPRYTKGPARAGHDFENAEGVIIAGMKQSAWPADAAWKRFGLGGLTLPPGIYVLEADDNNTNMNIRLTGGQAAYDHLVNQLGAKMGQGQDFEGDLAFWNEKTGIVVYIGLDDDEVSLTVEKQ